MENLNLFDFFKVSKEVQKLLIMENDEADFTIANFHNIQKNNTILFLGLNERIAESKLFSICIPEESLNDILLSTLIKSLTEIKLDQEQWVLFNPNIEMDENNLKLQYCLLADLKSAGGNLNQVRKFLGQFVTKEQILQDGKIEGDY